MKNLLLATLSFLLSLNGFGQPIVATDEAPSILQHTTPEQSKLIIENTLSFPGKTQLSIALIKNSKVTFTGIERLNNTLKYTDNSQKVFEIGSISKVFTSTLLANLVLSNKISLSDKIDSCIDLPINFRDTFTLLQLANHTSGLPRLPVNLNLATVDFRNPYKEYTEEDLLEYLSNDTTFRESPGKQYEYSNLGTGLLAYLMGKKEGADYETLLKKYIFDKYKMNHSTAIRTKLNVELVTGLDVNGNNTSNWDFNVLVGAGGILSNVSDLSKFAQAQFDFTNTELALTREATFKVNEQMDIGLGWHILHNEPRESWYWHNGGTGGYSSSMAVNVKNKTAVIILSNMSAFNPERNKIDELCFGLLKTLKK